MISPYRYYVNSYLMLRHINSKPAEYLENEFEFSTHTKGFVVLTNMIKPVQSTRYCIPKNKYFL